MTAENAPQPQSDRPLPTAAEQAVLRQEIEGQMAGGVLRAPEVETLPTDTRVENAARISMITTVEVVPSLAAPDAVTTPFVASPGDRPLPSEFDQAALTQDIQAQVAAEQGAPNSKVA